MSIFDIRSLYEKKLYYPWCDSEGNINTPGCAAVNGTVEDMPSRIQWIYKECWRGDTSATEYVVTINCQYGLLFSWELDKEWLGEMGMPAKDLSDRTKLCTLAHSVTEKLKSELGSKAVPAYYVDPDGEACEVGFVVLEDELNDRINYQLPWFRSVDMINKIGALLFDLAANEIKRSVRGSQAIHKMKLGVELLSGDDQTLIEEVLGDYLSIEELEMLCRDWGAFCKNPERYKGTDIVTAILQYLEEQHSQK